MLFNWIFQMTLWCMSKSPIMYGGDLRNIDDMTYSIITNPTLLEINSFSSNNMEASSAFSVLIIWKLGDFLDIDIFTSYFCCLHSFLKLLQQQRYQNVESRLWNGISDIRSHQFHLYWVSPNVRIRTLLVGLLNVSIEVLKKYAGRQIQSLNIKRHYVYIKEDLELQCNWFDAPVLIFLWVYSIVRKLCSAAEIKRQLLALIKWNFYRRLLARWTFAWMLLRKESVVLKSSWGGHFFGVVDMRTRFVGS